MKSELQHFLSQLRSIQEDMEASVCLSPLNTVARRAMIRIEGRLARTLGELDYLVNLKIGTTTDDRHNSVQRTRD